MTTVESLTILSRGPLMVQLGHGYALSTQQEMDEKLGQPYQNIFVGDAERDRVKDAAYAAINQASYFGDKKQFSFETYVTIHQEAYEDLE